MCLILVGLYSVYICKAYRGISVIVVLVKERLGVRLLQKGTRNKAQGQLKSVFDCVHFVLLFTRDRTTRAIIQRATLDCCPNAEQ